MDNDLIRGLEAVGAQRLVVIGRSGIMRAGFAAGRDPKYRGAVVVRKPGEKASYHDGPTYDNWGDDPLTFVDDTIDSGRTLWRVARACAWSCRDLRGAVISCFIPELRRLQLFRYIPSLTAIHCGAELYLRPDGVVDVQSVPGHAIDSDNWENPPW